MEDSCIDPNVGGAGLSVPSAQPGFATLSAASGTSQSNEDSPEGTQNGGIPSKLSSSSKTSHTSLSTVGPDSRAREEASTSQQDKVTARQQRLEENRKRKRRENIAGEVGHEVDSDGEREYWLRYLSDAGEDYARRQALSPEARRQEDIANSAEGLRDHIKPQLTLDYSGQACLYRYPLFLLQIAPDSRQGATCRLDHCTDRIFPGQYRIAVCPGSWDSRGPDHYHVKCFEELLDLTSPHYVARFEPDRQKHIPDYGAQRILEEYISRWKLRIKPTHKHDEDPQLSSSTETTMAESSSTQKSSPAANKNTNANTTQQRVASPEVCSEPTVPDDRQIQTPSVPEIAIQSSLASKQTDEPDVWSLADMLWNQAREAEAEASKGHTSLIDILSNVDDQEDLDDSTVTERRTWHITQYLRSEDDSDYDERHALSRALAAWKFDIMLANKDRDKLPEAGRAAKDALGELTIKIIKRFQSVWMPARQSMFLGRGSIPR